MTAGGPRLFEVTSSGGGLPLGCGNASGDPRFEVVYRQIDAVPVSTGSPIKWSASNDSFPLPSSADCVARCEVKEEGPLDIPWWPKPYELPTPGDTVACRTGWSLLASERETLGEKAILCSNAILDSPFCL